ncbi:hypothetical protein KOR42_53790 [Thalassoglobus neptunius]|uniref:Uncharacterized protein n=1 Tax=Thalassoglobus neptunius TaxID=1938619 RepID=A0A5C5V4E5_9PLAN|nr:hypothetical protein KOR42_53790 [Thalassoglobus neptunius]
MSTQRSTTNNSCQQDAEFAPVTSTMTDQIHNAWLHAVLDVLEGLHHTCPSCKNGEVKAVFFGDQQSRRGYILAWCDRCNTGIHISRAKANKNVHIESRDPDNPLHKQIPNFRPIF